MSDTIVRYAYGTGAVSNTATGILLGSNAGVGAVDFSTSFALYHLEIQFTSLAGGATEISELVLAWDSAGDDILSAKVPDPDTSGATKTIVTGKTTATNGSVVLDFGSSLSFNGLETTTGKLYAWLTLNAGTATAAVYAYFSPLRT